MELVLVLVGGLAPIVWIGLLGAHAGFWRADRRLGDLPAPEHWPAVTAGFAHSAGAEVLAAAAPAPGWTGKLHALETGVAASDTEFLWFTDADIVHSSDILRRLVARALAEDRDLASLMVKLHVESRWERLLIPAFIFFFQMLYPFPAVNDPHNRIAGAAGGCILIRRSALTRAGGLAGLADALIDDCTLARRVQDSGGRLWLGLGESSISLRKAEGLALPLVAALYMAMTVDSALARWRGAGSAWKGRAYNTRGKGA